MIRLLTTTAAVGLRRLSARLPLRRLMRHQGGSSAVEFSLVALPFIALLFAIIETAIVFFAGQTLEAAAATTSRLILTGQVQTQNMTAAMFKNEVCKRLTALFDCAGGVYVDVKLYSDFASTGNAASPVSNGTLDTSKFGFAPGGPGDIVVMKLYYKWPIYVTLLNTGIADLGSNRLLVATAAFRNEPYL
jgi:Flp pilus assembly protein TadG